jgi:hypothetical protein
VVLNGKVPTNVLQSIGDSVRLGFPDVDYCPRKFSVLIEKCWATNAVDHPQFCIICQLSVAIFLKHPYGGEDVPPDYP